jgi:regulator of sigma E protease
MAVISFALAIFNLLPLPVLDGGHIFFGLLEIIFRRPVPQKLIKILSYIFVTLLISLMVFVTFFDIRRAVNKIIPDKNPPAEQVKDATQNP